ncbi:MAG: N-acetylmuramoyl-L-alanine amidase, partial [Chitinophagaceae bacterium]|nr:N-acetylmuramoyl-L-alanine amidase [Chitinophagaceae bacterium]
MQRILFIALAFIMASFSSMNLLAQQQTPFTIVVEAAHGDTDPGANINGVKEKDLLLNYAKTLEELAPSMNIKVVLARANDTRFDMNERSNLAGKSNAIAYIILHADASNNTNNHGMEIFTGRKSLSMDNRILGKFLGAELYNFGKLTVNGVNINDNHTARLDAVKVPAALINLGYMSNSNDLSILQNNVNRVAL